MRLSLQAFDTRNLNWAKTSSEILVASLLGLALAAHAAPALTTIAEDSFDYPANVSLVGKNGGTGWTGAWESDSSAFPDFFTDGAGLSVPGVAGTGGKMVFRQQATQLNDAGRNLPSQSSGVVFLQFISQFGVQSGGGTPSIRLLNVGGSWTGGVGNNGSCGGRKVYAILDSNLQAGVAAACTNIALSTLAAVVLRIDYVAQNTRLWVLPSLAGFDYLNPPAPSAEYAGLAPTFDRIAIYSRFSASIDELRVFRLPTLAAPAPTPVPATSRYVLLALVLSLLGWGVHQLGRRRISAKPPPLSG